MKMLFLVLLILFSFVAHSEVIVIDPGHGGEDIGTKSNFNGKLYEEKELSLVYSKLLYDELKKDYSVYLTRSIDRKVGLNERTEIAEKVNASLFISLHLNYSSNKNAKGIEIYYLDNHDDLAVKKIEDEENRSFLDEDKVIDKILLDLIIQKTVVKSKDLANQVHKNLSKGTFKKFKLKDRGVRAGLFYVLAKAQRPSLLVEVGFMSSDKELQRLLNKDFQKDFVKNLRIGIVEFLNGEKKVKNAIPIL